MKAKPSQHSSSLGADVDNALNDINLCTKTILINTLDQIKLIDIKSTICQ